MVYTKKSAYKKKTYVKRGKSTKSKTNANLVSMIKRVTLKQAESKYKTHDHGHIELYHNTFTAYDLLESSQLPAVGTAQSQRIGDKINLGGIYCRLLIGQKIDRPNCTFRYYVVSCDRAVSYLYGTFFKNIMNNVLLDSPNKDYIKVHKSGYVKQGYSASAHFSGTSGASHEKTTPFKIWIPYRKLISFGPNDGDQTHQGRKLFLLLAPFDAYGTLVTDNIGYADFTQTVYYKDP